MSRSEAVDTGLGRRPVDGWIASVEADHMVLAAAVLEETELAPRL